MKQLPILLLGIFLSWQVMADEKACQVDLAYDLSVSPQTLAVKTKDLTLYEIREGGELLIKRVAVDLTSEQSALAAQYAQEVSVLMMQWITLVSTALEVTGESLDAAFSGAFGKDSLTADKSAKAIGAAQREFEDRSRAQDGVYTVKANEFNALEDSFGGEFNTGVEELVLASIGTLFAEVGKALTSGDGTLEERMEALGKRLERMGEELDTVGGAIEDAATSLCLEVKEVQKLERRLLKEIPELAKYPLFK